MGCRRVAVRHCQIAAASHFYHRTAAGHRDRMTVQVKGDGFCYIQRRVDGIVPAQRYRRVVAAVQQALQVVIRCKYRLWDEHKHHTKGKQDA